jgi:hypothetical protein
LQWFQAARAAAGHLQRLWHLPQALALLRQPPPANLNTPLLTQLMQQSRQHADVIAAALRFGVQQIRARQNPTDWQQQQQEEQGAMLVLDFLGIPGHSSAARLLFFLLTWLSCKPGIAADLWQNLGPNAAADGAGRTYCVQDVWLAGMQVWQQLLLLTATVVQSGTDLSAQRVVMTSLGEFVWGEPWVLRVRECLCARDIPRNLEPLNAALCCQHALVRTLHHATGACNYRQYVLR